MARRWLLPFVFVLLSPAYLVSLSTPAVGAFHDDGIYLVTARALAEDGEYSIQSLPESLPQTKYPVLFPLMLAGVWSINPDFPNNVLYLKLVPFACAVAWFVMCGLLLRRLGASPVEAGTMVCLTAASPLVVYLGTSLLADLPFAAFAATALYVGEAEDRAGRIPAWLRPFVVGGLAGLAYLASTRGISLWLAVVGVYCLRRKWRPALEMSAGFALLSVPWTVWQALNQAPSNPAYWYYSRLSYQTWHIFGGLSFGQALRVVYENAARVIAWPDLILCPAMNAPKGILLHLVAWSALILVLIGFLQTVRQGVRITHLWVVWYLAIVLAWLWTPDRFLAPLVPFFLYYLIAGVKELQCRIRLGATPARVVVWAVLIAALLAEARGLWKDTAIVLKEDAPTFRGGEPDNWQATMELMEWLKRETPRDSVVGSCLDPMVNLFSERKSIRPFRVRPYSLCYDKQREIHALGDMQEFRSHLLVNRVSYLHFSPMASFHERRHFFVLFGETAEAYPGVFRIAKQAFDPRYFIVRVDLGVLAGDACPN